MASAFKSQPELFTIITRVVARFRSTGDSCGRLYRLLGVLMSRRRAMANGVVSGVRGKRPHRDYHSQEALGEVWLAQALRVLATHFRGQGKGSNEQPCLGPRFDGRCCYTVATIHCNLALMENVAIL